MPKAARRMSRASVRSTAGAGTAAAAGEATGLSGDAFDDLGDEEERIQTC
ncbi:hypothetical protein [Streptomyces peucetius]